MNLRNLMAAAILACAGPAWAAQLESIERYTRELPILLGGSLVLDNPVGDIEVIGTDDTKIVIVAEERVRALDEAALAEGKDQTKLALLGDEKLRIVRTMTPPIHSSKWTSGMKYTVRVPRTIHLKVTSSIASHIRVAQMRGNVFVRCFNGTVTLDGVTGPSTVDSANANVLFAAPGRGLNNAQLSTVNGAIEVRVPAGATFRWIAETMGDARTTMPVRGAFVGARYSGSVNGDAAGPIITTQSITGHILLLQNGTQLAAARPLRGGPSLQPQTVAMTTFEKPNVRGLRQYFTSRGNIIVGQVHGNADVGTGAGEIQLGAVFGDAKVISQGGPLSLGDVVGNLIAQTEAGDVSVESARSGGTIITGGGTIRLLRNDGNMKLLTGGGDIYVRQASAGINAETQSGDITITLDQMSKSERVTAKTAKGNVILNVMPAFSADIDATIITSDPNANKISTDLAGLEFRREQIGGKTKIRATGKVNGGGDRVELYAEDGGIQINSRAVVPAP